MRVRSRWFREDNAKDPGAVASAAAFIAFRLARETLARMRKAGFGIEAGPRYFDVLAEALVFAIQCGCRVAWRHLAPEAREPFATALAHRAADHLAQNQAELLGAEPAEDVRRAFIGRLNQRFAEYADFDYGAEGPDFAFLRYYAGLLAERMPREDRRWTYDQVIAIEGPHAASIVERSIGELFGAGGPKPRRASAVSE